MRHFRLILTNECKKELNEMITDIRTYGRDDVVTTCINTREITYLTSLVLGYTNMIEGTVSIFNYRHKYFDVLVPEIDIQRDAHFYNKSDKKLERKVNAILGYMKRTNSLHTLFTKLLRNKGTITVKELQDVCFMVDNISSATNSYPYNVQLLNEMFDILVDMECIRVDKGGNPIIRRGKFIVLEGVDGIGKSTLLEKIKDKYPSVVVTRQPGGTDIGEQIREVLLSSSNSEMDDYTELLLYAAARNQHIKETLHQLLDTGVDVICDRYYYSSILYQKDAMKNISSYCIRTIFNDILIPDLVIALYTDNMDSIKEEIGNKIMDRLEHSKWNKFDEINLGYKLLGTNKNMLAIEGASLPRNIQSVNYTDRNADRVLAHIEAIIGGEDWI